LPADYPFARAVKVYRNRLYVAGSFGFDVTGSYSNMAVWDGSQWQVLDGGFDGSVDALEVYQDELIVGGNFERVGDMPSAGWARWKDTSPTCGDWGYLNADINLSCTVDLADFAMLASYWLQNDCWNQQACQNADIDQNGQVGMSDLLDMASHWLGCTDPQGAGCEEVAVEE
jgi:hypothetical protein